VGGEKMRNLSLNEFDMAYDLFERSFVPAELRPYEKMKMRFCHHDFKIYGYFQNEQLLAAISVWEFKDFIYVENFAVDEKLRGKGIGSSLLKELRSLYPKQLLILEVEVPYDDISQRRIGFYERCGYCLNLFTFQQPPLRENAQDVQLMIMSYPFQLTRARFEELKEELFRIVYETVGGE